MGALFSVIGLSLMSAFLIILTSVGKDRTTLIRFASKPAVVTVRKQDSGKDSEADDGIENVTLQKLVENKCKCLFTDFRPLWYLFKYVENCFPPPLPCSLTSFADTKWASADFLLRAR
jgi:hypothetical protein